MNSAGCSYKIMYIYATLIIKEKETMTIRDYGEGQWRNWREKREEGK